MTRAFVHAAAWWDPHAGPPRAELLPRAERLAASFATRILAHVLGDVASRSPAPLSELPWVLGSADGAGEPGPELRRALAPSRSLALVHAGPATVAMALLEALAGLVEHEAVLVAFADDATPPHHEALAAALVLSRITTGEPVLVLEPPVLRRTSSHSPRAEAKHPFMAARALAHAAAVGRPTVETVPSGGAERRDRWQIELTRGF
jgi:hypothetical protein